MALGFLFFIIMFVFVLLINLKFHHFSHLKFTLLKFPFVTKRIYYCVISFNGDSKESNNGRNSSNPRDVGVCQKLAQDSASQAVWMMGER